ncbi:hypothetical protein DPMN_151491 [Dreissena polymorpha]|uniref:Uncharacterized protein n=1 Tax=Dreissena polymorpha TaxID=45954 RepID=A0A9D4J305_DREPO|nr:hypothetical protein DPMN_151491 [Dreissena polymorpha]
MRYDDTTKLFWKCGWRIFGGRFINFMSGFKNKTFDQDVCTEKQYSPTSSTLNFAVPDIKVIQSFNTYTSESQRDPGICNDGIKSIGQNSGHRSACLTFDGKKIKQGLTKFCGDIDLIGFEDGETLHDKRNRLEDITAELSALGQTAAVVEQKIGLPNLPIENKEQIKKTCWTLLRKYQPEYNTWIS